MHSRNFGDTVGPARGVAAKSSYTTSTCVMIPIYQVKKQIEIDASTSVRDNGTVRELNVPKDKLEVLEKIVSSRNIMDLKISIKFSSFLIP